MSRRSAAFFLTLLMLATVRCRRTSSRLDDVPRIAYGSKPAVVRVNAYATATLRYPAAVIRTVGDAMVVDPRNLTGADGAVETGAGGSGSGFIIRSNGYILTSGHVVTITRDPVALERDLRRNGAIAVLVKHFPKDELRKRQQSTELERYIDAIGRTGHLEGVTIVNEIELSNGESLHFTVVRYSPDLGERGADLALLKIDRHDLPTLPLGDSDTVRVGDSIWTVGYPAVASSTDEVIGGWLSRDSDLEATFNLGTITAIKRDVANREVFQSDVAVYHGNSGGPAVDRSGQVVAIATWGHSAAEQIKFLVPINVARSFVAAAAVHPDGAGEFNRYYRAALDAANSGNWSVARADLDIASRVFPHSPDIERFSGDIDRGLRETPWWQLHPVAAALSAIVGIGLLCIGLVALFRAVLLHPPGPMATLAASGGAAGTFSTVMPAGRDDSAAPRGSMLGKFTILNGSRAGERLGLGGTGIRIGRESAICEIVLENPKVSRLHAEVVSMDGKVLLIDRNSSNGTFVNDQKIDRRYLRDGDIIYFGGRNAIAVAFHR